MNLKNLEKSLIESRIIQKKEYSYFINPLCDGIPEIKPALIEEVADEISQRIQKYGKIDKIVTIEAMGIPISTAVSLITKIPLTIIRKKPYHLKNEISVKQKTGYSTSELFINDLTKKDEIIIIDDVLSTTGTLESIIPSLKRVGVKIKAIIIVINKNNTPQEITKKYEIPIETLIDIKIIDNKIVIK